MVRPSSLALLAAGCLAFFTPQASQAPPPAQNPPPKAAPVAASKAITDADIESVLQSLEQSFTKRKEEDGTSTFEFKIADATVQLYQFAGEGGVESLRLNAGWAFGSSARPSIDKINAFNANRRFVKAFLDVDKDPFLVQDIELTGGWSRDNLRASIARYRVILPIFVREVIQSR